MDAFYFFMVFVVYISQFILKRVFVSYYAEEMRDTHVYKQFIWMSVFLFLPLIATIWLLDRGKPQPLYALLLALLFFYRGYMELTYIKESRRHKVSFIVGFILLGFAVLLLILRMFN